MTSTCLCDCELSILVISSLYLNQMMLLTRRLIFFIPVFSTIASFKQILLESILADFLFHYYFFKKFKCYMTIIWNVQLYMLEKYENWYDHLITNN